MKYTFRNALDEDIEYLKKCKLYNILEYAGELSNQEIKDIKLYVDKTVSKEIGDYRIIMVGEKDAGCILVGNKEDKFMLDEIYLEGEFRGKGIGTDVIKSILKEKSVVYLWVYKLNDNAVKLYKRLGFCIIDETETRYFMKASSKGGNYNE